MKEFKLNDRVSAVCEYKKARSGFNHFCDLYVDGSKVSKAKCHYENRTWESYEYQSVMQEALRKAEKFMPADLYKQSEKFVKEYKEENPFGALAMVMKMGEVLTDNKAEANAWKLRMVKAGMPVEVPEDWDTLSEDEKERRLNGVMKVAKGE